MKKILIYLILLTGSMMLSECELDVVPSDALTGQQIKQSTDGLVGLVNGCYAIFKDYPSGEDGGNNWYLRQYFQLSDFASDDIVCGYKTEDDLIIAFRYNDRAPEKSNLNSFWSQSYKVIYGANVAIKIAEEATESDLTNQLMGEAYFLRAFATFDLVRLFAVPYSSANKSKPGVIIRENSSDGQPKARATLEETYNYIISSLKTASALMGEEISPDRDSKGFASKYAAWALLSRVYLYKEDYTNCIAYSDSVINSGYYGLESAESFPDYFANAKSSDETIWCIPFISVDDKKSGSVASMIYNGESCWGEEGASPSILNDMGMGTEMQDIDQRWSYINTDEPGEKNGVPLYYISKFSGQDGLPTLSSPVMLRLAEVYLNRAEAFAKQTNVAGAVDDLNTIRENRLIADDLTPYLYNASDYSASTITDAVLKERRIELAFEGQRVFDLLRNNKELDRVYWGFHLDNYNGVPDSEEPDKSEAGAIIDFTPNTYLYPIPDGEINTNKLCVQNF